MVLGNKDLSEDVALGTDPKTLMRDSRPKLGEGHSRQREALGHALHGQP